jgi:hypothetical protein
MTGVYRCIPHDDLLARLAQGWRWCADLGDVHGEWSSAAESQGRFGPIPLRRVGEIGAPRDLIELEPE